MSSIPIRISEGILTELAAFMGAVRFRNMSRTYHPFIFLLWLVVLQVFINGLLSRRAKELQSFNNLSLLLESLLLLGVFYQLGQWQCKRLRYPFLGAAILCCCSADMFFWQHLREQYHLSRILCSLPSIFFGINQINYSLISERGKPFKQARFLIGTSTLLRCTTQFFFGIFFLFKLPLNTEFHYRLYCLQTFGRCCCALFYINAVIRIPTRERFRLTN